MRLFVAVFPPEELQMILWELGEEVKGSWRREPPEKIHVTLKFIGEVSEERFKSIDEALSLIRHPSFSVEVRGVGAFPSMERPRVLWAGASSPGLISLQRAVEDALVSLGIPREWRDFIPHLTLGRVKGRVDASAFFRHRDKLFGNFMVQEFALVESILKPSGSVYKVLRRYGLED